MFSVKHAGAAWSYELAITLDGGLIRMNGPFEAGTFNDIKIFREKDGLLDQMKQRGMKAIGDGGYRGEPEYVSFFNSHDTRQVAKFKRRALE